MLGLEDRAEEDQQDIFDELSQQLQRSEKGWYESGLLWKVGHAPLLKNERGSKRRLEGLLKKLQRETGDVRQVRCDHTRAVG